jgi:hypothetical protein
MEEDNEEYRERWYKELSIAIKEDSDIKLRMEAWQLLNPPPQLALTEKNTIIIPKIKLEQE